MGVLFLQIQQLIRGAKNAVSLAQVCFYCSKVLVSFCLIESFADCYKSPWRH